MINEIRSALQNMENSPGRLPIITTSNTTSMDEAQDQYEPTLSLTWYNIYDSHLHITEETVKVEHTDECSNEAIGESDKHTCNEDNRESTHKPEAKVKTEYNDEEQVTCNVEDVNDDKHTIKSELVNIYGKLEVTGNGHFITFGGKNVVKSELSGVLGSEEKPMDESGETCEDEKQRWKRRNNQFHSMMEKNTGDSYEERKRKRQINDSFNDEKVEEERNRKNREKCKRYREKKMNEVAAPPISGPFDSDAKKREEERKQKNREKTKRWREKKKKEVATVSISGPFDSDAKKREEERKQKNREKTKRWREKKKNEVAAVFISGPFDSDEEKREEERKQKNREKTKRWREKKKNEVAAVYICSPFDSDRKKREEERKQKNREKNRRFREKKKNEIEVAALSMATADSSSDSSGTKMEQARQKQMNAEKCKRYRDKKRTSNLLITKYF